MIVSQVIALLGVHKAAHFRHDWPFVIPIHVALYLTHMLQVDGIQLNIWLCVSSIYKPYLVIVAD